MAPDQGELLAALENHLPQVVQVTRTPGLNVAVAIGDRVVWEAGFGFADLARRTRMTAETTSRVGSFSKIYVATAVMQLVERGILHLHSPANQYLPSLRLVNPLGEREVTIYDLLTYRSGLGTDTGEYDFGHQPSLGRYLERAYQRPVRPEYNHGLPRWTAKVGDRYQYSSFGIATLGYLVERTNPEKLDFAEYVRQHITEPLRLNSSAFPPSGDPSTIRPDLRARLARGYSRFGSTFVPTPLLYSPVSPAVGLVTTPGDQLRLLISYMKTLAGNRGLVEHLTAQFMTSPQVRISEFVADADEWNGLGFEMREPFSDTFYFGHGGAVPFGWYSYCAAFPRQGFAVVVCTNKWDMTRFFNPTNELATGVVIDFISNWFRHQGIEKPQGQLRSWEWKASYIMGMMMVERTRGLLGASGHIDAETVTTMIDDSCSGAGPDRGKLDAEGFRQGVADMLKVEPTPDRIRDFVERTPYVASEELPLFGLAFGKRPDIRTPLPFFARPGRPSY